MARIAGVDLPKNKHLFIGLTYIFGIGKKRALEICEKTEISPNKKVGELTEAEIKKIREFIDKNYKVEGELRREIAMNIKRLIDMGCYRGIRHKKGLPVRGQRTHTNARTRKGPRRGILTRKKQQTK